MTFSQSPENEDLKKKISCLYLYYLWQTFLEVVDLSHLAVKKLTTDKMQNICSLINEYSGFIKHTLLKLV